MFVLFKPFVLYFDDVHWMVLVTVDSMCCEVMAELPPIHFKFALVSMFFFGGWGDWLFALQKPKAAGCLVGFLMNSYRNWRLNLWLYTHTSGVLRHG